MSSLYLNRLSPQEKSALVCTLHQTQHGVCFLCEEPIDLVIHKDSLDIDHIVPISLSGKDDPSNFALTHASCNRSKQTTNLEIARILQRFAKLRDSLSDQNRGPDLSDVLKEYDGARYAFKCARKQSSFSFSFPEIGQNQIDSTPIYVDQLSGFEYFFAIIPIEYLKCAPKTGQDFGGC